MKTTPEHFELFKAEFLRLAQVLQLGGYEFVFVNKKNADNAWIQSNELRDRRIEVGLNTNTENNAPEVIKALARHEVCETFLNRLDVLAKFRYTTEAEIDEERHNIIRVLEKVLA